MDDGKDGQPTPGALTEDHLRDPASVVIQRRVEWHDTDAAGIYQYGSVLRWVDAAEAVLHERLGIVSETFGCSPRAHVEVTYRAPLLFLDRVDVELRVAEIGRTSLRYEFTVRKGEEVSSYGSLTTVHTDAASVRPMPWPPRLRRALAEGGSQRPELLT